MPAKEEMNNFVSCTAASMTQKIKLPELNNPKDLFHALQCIWTPHCFALPGKCENYVKCIRSLFNLKKIKSQDYLVILKLCLYLEQYTLDLEMKQHTLTNYNIKKAKDLNDHFIITMPSLSTDDSIIKVYDKVTLYEATTKKAISGIVVAVVGNEVTMQLCNSQDLGILKKGNKKFNINFRSQHWPLRCCHYALKITSYREWNQVLYPKLKPNYIYPKYDIDEWINPNISKNEEQKQAVRSILNKTSYPAPYIIFGPPGTGKTATLVETICQILRQRPMEYILVCTKSNAAADDVTKRLLQYVPTNIVHRMYALSKEWSTVDKTIQPCTNFVKESPIFLPKEILLMKNVIVTTLITSIRLIGKNFREDHFSYIFIDEASQATEPEILIPFTITSEFNEINNAKFQAQIVIMGDPYQLGPIVRCKEIEHLYGISMLERLMNNCSPYKKKNGKYNSNYITKLLKNFRNHESFLYISNNEFYDNELEICGGNDIQITLNWSKLPNQNFPMIFQEVLGKEERSLNRSAFNKVEALVVVKYVSMLIGTKFGKHILTQKDIGIITPFKQQQLEITYQLGLIKQEDITVGTVEMFQGQERTVMILSTVRNKIFNHDGVEHIGFLSNRKRFNVAMTRAKALMIIIGNPKVICKNKYWKLLWEYCRKQGSSIPFTQCPLNQNYITELISNEKKYLDKNASNIKKLSVTVMFDSTMDTGTLEPTDIMSTKTLDVLVRAMENSTL